MNDPASPTPLAKQTVPPLTWRRPLAWAFDRAIAGYQRWISPMLPPACRFTPSCSHYAREALQHHGTFRAVLLTTWRLLRCQPLCRGGHDPVPPGRYTSHTRAADPLPSDSFSCACATPLAPKVS